MDEAIKYSRIMGSWDQKYGEGGDKEEGEMMGVLKQEAAWKMILLDVGKALREWDLVQKKGPFQG